MGATSKLFYCILAEFLSFITIFCSYFYMAQKHKIMVAAWARAGKKGNSINYLIQIQKFHHQQPTLQIMCSFFQNLSEPESECRYAGSVNCNISDQDAQLQVWKFSSTKYKSYWCIPEHVVQAFDG